MTSHSAAAADESLSEDNFELVESVESEEQKAKSVANESVELLRKMSTEIDRLSRAMDAIQKTNDAKDGVFAKFAVRFTGISNMVEDEEVFSAPVHVAGMEWAIVLKRESGDSYNGPYTTLKIRRMSPSSAVCEVTYEMKIACPDGSRGEFEDSVFFDSTRSETDRGNFNDKDLLAPDYYDIDSNFFEADSILVEVKMRVHSAVKDVPFVVIPKKGST